MKTLREALDDFYNEIDADLLNDFEIAVLQKHLAPLLAPLLVPPQDTRKAEVARIAEALYIRLQATEYYYKAGTQTCIKLAFEMAEKFAAHKESL